MSLSKSSPSRANIRIEIKNDFTEKMDVSGDEVVNESSNDEIEDGEVSDSKDVQVSQFMEARNKIVYSRSSASNRLENQWTNGDGGFTTGVDIFGKDAKEKLQTRAQRFGLDPTECKNMTDEELQELYSSLGIAEENEIDVRFEAIHMYGTQEMSTQDVFAYFAKYGPASIEWINDISCNVVWHDRISTARAFYGLSERLSGMPVTGNCNPFKETDEKEEGFKSRSILLINTENSKNEDGEYSNDKNVKHVSELNIPVPPGYWRLGYTHSKANCILLRYARRTDKKPFRAEKFSEYYKKYGNPNFGGMVGLISESKKRKLKDRHLKENEDKDIPEQRGNPWGDLAKNWNHDIQEEPIEVRQPFQVKPGKLIMERLGIVVKRQLSDEEVVEGKSEENVKKSKIPRMRMYADEEEARIKKIKEMKKIRVLEDIEEKMTKKEKIPDLRHRLGKHEIKKDKPESLKKPLRLTGQKQPERTRKYSSSEYSDDELELQQKSKVTVIVKKQCKPTMASTVWSRLDMEKERQKQLRLGKRELVSASDSSSQYSDTDASDSDNIEIKTTMTKPMANRPEFRKGDMKSRLGFKTTEHKSPLRIEINNDHYKERKS